MMSKVDSMISKLGGPGAWNKTKELIWIQHRMHARQILESFGDPDVDNDSILFEGWKYQYDKIKNGEMIYAAISQLGLLLVHVLKGAKNCSEDNAIFCQSNPMLNSALRQTKRLIQNLESRKSVFEYTKQSAKMLHKVFQGIKNLAEHARPYGLKCLIKKDCKAREKNFVSKLLTGPLKKATEIQKKFMIQNSATPTLLFMPSYEIYGYVLLALEKYKQAQKMFETSLMERMGRTLSLLGLARSHARLGNTKKAKYFYQYLRTQLQDSDQNNPVGREAENWSESTRDHWFWPYYLS